MGFLNKLRAPKASIGVFLDKQIFSLREPITGKLVVSSSEEFQADEVRLELLVTEWTRATESKTIGQQTANVTCQQTTTLHRGNINVAGSMTLKEGFNKEFPFNIYLPSGVPPTYRSQNVQTRWMLKGVIGVKGRPDVTSHDIEIQVTY